MPKDAITQQGDAQDADRQLSFRDVIRAAREFIVRQGGTIAIGNMTEE